MSYHIQHHLSKLNFALFLLWVSLFSLGQLQRIELGRGITIYGLDIVIVGWTAVLALSEKLSVKSLFSITFLKKKYGEMAWLGWLIVGLLVTAVNGESLMLPLMYLGRLSLYLLFGYYLKKALSQSSAFITPSRARWLLILTGVLIASWGLLQYALLPDTRWLSILGWDDHYYRLISTLLDPAFTGLILVITFIWLQRPVSPPYRHWQKLLSVLLLGAITLTFSRSTYLSLASGLVLLTVFAASHRRLGFMYGILFLAFIAMAPKPGGEGVNLTRTASITRRQDNATSILSSLQPYQWIVGRGLFVPYRPVTEQLNEVEISQHARIPDNVLVFFISGMGVVGLFLTGIVGFKSLRWTYHWDRLLWISCVSLLVHSLFNASLVQPQIVLFLIGGIASLESKPATS